MKIFIINAVCIDSTSAILSYTHFLLMVLRKFFVLDQGFIAHSLQWSEQLVILAKEFVNHHISLEISVQSHYTAVSRML